MPTPTQTSPTPVSPMWLLNPATGERTLIPTTPPRLVRVQLRNPGEFEDWPDGIVRVEGGLVWVSDPVDGARVGYPLHRVVAIREGPPDAMPG